MVKRNTIATTKTIIVKKLKAAKEQSLNKIHRIKISFNKSWRRSGQIQNVSLHIKWNPASIFL